MKVHLLLPFLFGILNAFVLTDKHEEESMESSDQAAKFLKRSFQNCGFKPKLADRIIRGKEAEEHSFPWMASIRLNGSHFCGASLIKPMYVLTAGHCFRFFGEKNSTNYRKYVPFLSVVLGDHYVNTTDPPEQIFRIADYKYLVPETNRSGVPLYNDVAVVKLDGTATVNKYVSTICLPYPPIAISPGDKVTVAGWGMSAYPNYDFTPNFSNVLKVIHTNVIKNEDCGNYYEPIDKNGNMIMYGQQAGEDFFCTLEENDQGVGFAGDSGGPVIYDDPLTGKYVQVGIVSYGNGRISEEGHAKVSYFLKKIEAMMADMDEN